MTIDLLQLLYFVGALFVMVLSPGPVVAALISRVLARGFHGAWPIVCAVVVGDFIWVSVSLLGLGAIIGENNLALQVIRYLGAMYLIYLGYSEIKHATAPIEAADMPSRSRFWPVFLAGLAIMMTNPKAALFYIVFLPQFFDVGSVTPIDIGVIALVGATIPFIVNMIWVGAANLAAKRLATASGRALLRRISGVSLILVAIFLVVF